MLDRIEAIKQMLRDGANYQVVATHFGISRERVRQIVQKAGVANLRNPKRRPVVVSAVDSTLGYTASKTDIALARLKELLHYDRFTGIWTWLVDRGPVRAGDIAGTENEEGYIQIRIDRKLYMAHVLAWFYSFEVWPAGEVDHEDRIKSHNWLNNLRPANHIQNLGNSPKRKHNTSGFKGVYRDGNKWRAEIAHIKLGRFNTVEEAGAAYDEASKSRYGRFAIAS